MSELDLQVSRLDLEEGDILVVRTRSRLSPERATAIQDQLQAVARGHGFTHVSVLVLDDCSDVSIERPRSTAMQHQAPRTTTTMGR